MKCHGGLVMIFQGGPIITEQVGPIIKNECGQIIKHLVSVGKNIQVARVARSVKSKMVR